jgi:hypothetical protein
VVVLLEAHQREAHGVFVQDELPELHGRLLRVAHVRRVGQVLEIEVDVVVEHVHQIASERRALGLLARRGQIAQVEVPAGPIEVTRVARIDQPLQRASRRRAVEVRGPRRQRPEPHEEHGRQHGDPPDQKRR